MVTGRGRRRPPVLTPRQLELLDAYLDTGHFGVAADRLGIREVHARQMISDGYRRMDVHNAAQLVWAARNQLAERRRATRTNVPD